MWRERRKYGRIEASFTIRILSYNYNKLNLDYSTHARGINISPNGVAFKYPRAISKDDHLKVIIQDLDGYDGEEIFAHVRIVWAEAKDILSRKFGGRFLKIAPDKKFKLIKLIREKLMSN